MKNMTFRLTLWAIAGFVVSLRWGLYFASADKSLPIGSNVYTLAFVTQPIATAIAYYLRTTTGVSLSSVAIINAATYALLGFVIETLRRHTPASRLTQI
jgi:hypothetical protein